MDNLGYGDFVLDMLPQRSPESPKDMYRYPFTSFHLPRYPTISQMAVAMEKESSLSWTGRLHTPYRVRARAWSRSERQ